MFGINKAILVGNLGKEPEIKFTGDGKAIATFSVATSESWTDKTSGQKVEKTEWHRCVVFGRLADVCKNFLRKGSKVYIEGQLRTTSWGEDDAKRYKTEIVLSGFNSVIQILDKKGEPKGEMEIGEFGEEKETIPNGEKTIPDYSEGSQPMIAPDVVPEKIKPVGKDEFDDDIPF